MTRPADPVIATNVRDALTWDSRINADNVQIAVKDGVVHLTGTVHLLAESAIAADVAWSIRGVRQVVNDLVVSASTLRPDADVAADVLRALAGDGRIDLADVVVRVAGGVVTFSGIVQGAAERRAAEQAAWYVPGVVAVDDRLTISPSHLRPDDDILRDVRFALDREARLADATRIAVEVRNGVVRLSGSVDRASDREVSEGNARFVAGVRSVINEIAVG